ncbi:hypothetical protein V6N11_034709 [Hibiscus sabdariffa]|uniref:Uncharacterized protein n=2 Tax=Hibiscus sabdariffa TaxID=183260 RepID=A0ABR1ZUX9_9ROSI
MKAKPRGPRHLEVAWSRHCMNGLSQLNHAGLLGAVGSTSPPRGGLVLPMETWGPPRHLEVALFSLSWNLADQICLHEMDGRLG